MKPLRVTFIDFLPVLASFLGIPAIVAQSSCPPGIVDVSANSFPSMITPGYYSGQLLVSFTLHLPSTMQTTNSQIKRALGVSLPPMRQSCAN